MAAVGAIVGTHPAFGDDCPLRAFSEQIPAMLGGATAILMQIAHPSVAAGVDQHSDFRSSTFPRFLNTMDLIFTVLYGTPQQAAAIAKRVHMIHARINGEVGETGQRYDAQDRRTQVWVWATLVYVAFDICERFVRPLSSKEKDAVYADWRSFALIFGITDDLIPKTINEFEAYVAHMIASELQVTDTARRLAKFIVSPWEELPWWFIFPKKMQRASELITVGLLPSDLCSRYGYELNNKAWEKVQAGIKKIYGKQKTSSSSLESSVFSMKRLFRKVARSATYYAPRAYVAAKRWKESVSNVWPVSRL